MNELTKGDRVLLTGGPWGGHSGEYVGPEKTLIGVLHKVRLDNGQTSLVHLVHIKRV